MIFAILTDDAKKFLFSLIVIFILGFIIVGLLGILVKKLMNWQGMKMDTLVADVVISKVITNKKDLTKYGNKKSWALFYKQSAIGLLLIALAFSALFIHFLVTGHWPDIFSYKAGEEGFRTLFYIFDFANPKYYVKVFGLTVLSEWPGLLNAPHFEVNAIASYFFLPLFLTGTIWYLTAVLAVISRKLRLHKLRTTIFEKSLEGYNQNTGFNNQINLLNQTQNQPVQNPNPDNNPPQQ